jgi:hypothetical protein
MGMRRAMLPKTVDRLWHVACGTFDSAFCWRPTPPYSPGIHLAYIGSVEQFPL